MKDFSMKSFVFALVLVCGLSLSAFAQPGGGEGGGSQLENDRITLHGLNQSTYSSVTHYGDDDPMITNLLANSAEWEYCRDTYADATPHVSSMPQYIEDFYDEVGDFVDFSYTWEYLHEVIDGEALATKNSNATTIDNWTGTPSLSTIQSNITSSYSQHIADYTALYATLKNTQFLNDIHDSALEVALWVLFL